MDWAKTIINLYSDGDGVWTKAQVHDAVEKGKITETEYETITGETYTAE